MNVVREELKLLKSELKKFEENLEEGLANLDVKSKSYQVADDKLQEAFKTNDNIITLNVGGKSFQVKLSTLISKKDTLFYIYLSKFLKEHDSIPSTLFFDRNYTYFPLIMDFIRTNYLHTKNLSKEEKEDLFEEIEFYGLSEVLKNKKVKQIDLGWCPTLSKSGACTIEENNSTLKVHSTNCYTHFVTNRLFETEDVLIEFEVAVTQTDNYLYIGVVNESFLFSTNCMCSNPSNSIYIQCDGTIHCNSVTTNHNDYKWNSKTVTIRVKLFSESKNVFISMEDKEELGPYTMIGSKFRFVAGHCNSGNGPITIKNSEEI